MIALARALTRAAVTRAEGARNFATKTIRVTFVKPDNTEQTVDAAVGASMLEVAHANGIDIEGEARPPLRGAERVRA
jgi:hypothetical protein